MTRLRPDIAISDVGGGTVSRACMVEDPNGEYAHISECIPKPNVPDEMEDGHVVYTYTDASIGDTKIIARFDCDGFPYYDICCIYCLRYKGWVGIVIGVLGLKPLHETHEVKDGKIVRIK